MSRPASLLLTAHFHPLLQFSSCHPNPLAFKPQPLWKESSAPLPWDPQPLQIPEKLKSVPSTVVQGLSVGSLTPAIVRGCARNLMGREEELCNLSPGVETHSG